MVSESTRRGSRPAQARATTCTAFRRTVQLCFSSRRSDFRCMRTAKSAVSVVLDSTERSYSLSDRHNVPRFPTPWSAMKPGRLRSGQSGGCIFCGSTHIDVGVRQNSFADTSKIKDKSKIQHDNPDSRIFLLVRSLATRRDES
jgi:hypothetical protein